MNKESWQDKLRKHLNNGSARQYRFDMPSVYVDTSVYDTFKYDKLIHDMILGRDINDELDALHIDQLGQVVKLRRLNRHESRAQKHQKDGKCEYCAYCPKNCEEVRPVGVGCRPLFSGDIVFIGVGHE